MTNAQEPREREEEARRILRKHVGDGEVGVSITWGGNPSIPAHAALQAMQEFAAPPSADAAMVEEDTRLSHACARLAKMADFGRIDSAYGDFSHPALTMIADVRVLLASRQPAGVPEGWRTIESAPKDGKTRVDLWKLAPDGRNGRRVANVLWDMNRSFNGGFARVAQPPAWVNEAGSEIHADGGRFTHWRYLPAAPATDEGE